MNKKKSCLIILDGWGHGAKDQTDAIFTARTPFMDSLLQNHPSSELITYGPNVGLPEGQMGNSEVGHMNIGAGRIVYQDLVRINKSIAEGDFFRNDTILRAFEGIGSGRLHFIGLVGEGGVHSSQSHLHALCEMAAKTGVTDFAVHAFMDGRDSDPHAGLNALDALERKVTETGGHIATVIGRYFAMDRDKRWERVKKAYDLLVNGSGASFASAREGVNDAYEKGVTDEFIEGFVVENGREVSVIAPGDTVFCFNFRTDRCREISEVLTQRDFPEYGMRALDIRYFTMTRYDASFKGVGVAFEKDDLAMTLGEVVSRAGMQQLRIAETEKYPHVTFFFSGGREHVFEGESRIMVNSPKVATYDLQPEMSAHEVTSSVIAHIEQHQPELVVLNFANPDMVGHTGVFEAIVKAVETTDSCLQSVVEAGLKSDYSFVIIADHGNADKAINSDGSANTAHTTNLVPVIVIAEGVNHVSSGILADVAPTLLDLLSLKQAPEMTGKSLIKP